MIDSWLQDVRYAARLVRRNPVFAATAAASLAIGIGANTTIFTIANALLFRPPSGVVEPSRLVDVGRSQNGNGFDNNSYPNYHDVRARNTVFTDIYTYRFGAEPMSLGGRDGAERIFGDMVSTLTPRRSAAILTSREGVWLVMGARLKPGVSVKQAQAELDTIGRALEREYPEQNRGRGLKVVASSPIPGNGAPVAAFMGLL